MKKILLATPMMPPTLGGPAIHAERISKYLSENGFDLEIINFEKFNKFPPVVRHLFAFVLILKKSLNKDLIFAFDGFSVAFPTVLAGLISKRKVIVRTVGDFVHEQYVESGKEIPMNSFYSQMLNKSIKLSFRQNIKLHLQKFALENCYGIILASHWQKKIFEEYYNLPKKVWIFANPKEEIPLSIKKDEIKKFIFICATRDVAFKNLTRLRSAFSKAKNELSGIVEIELDTKTSDRNQLLSRIYNARAYICASISDLFPNTVVDAISLGTPIILTKNTGLVDFVKDSEVGFYIDPFDEESIKKAIIDMCDPVIWSNFKKQLEDYSWPESWPTLLLKYKQLIDSET